MSDLNMVAMVGRVTQDAVLKKSAAGTFISNFCIATSRAIKAGDTWEEKPHFFWLNLFGKRAENMHPYLLKGQTVSIEGHLELDKWTSNGLQHSRVSLVIDEIRLIGSLKKDAQADAKDADSGTKQKGDIDVPEDNTDPDFDMEFNPEDMQGLK